MTQVNEEINPASQRHWMYGFNVALLVVIGVVVLGFLMVLADATRGHVQTDWSSSGINSLSGSSKTLLADINKKGQDFQILSLFTDPSDEAKRNGDPDKQAEKRRQVLDLLQLYKRGNSHIQIEDAGDAAREDIERRVRDKYKDELKPYQDVVEAFDPLAKKLSTFMTQESAAIAANAQQQNAKPEEIEAAASMQAMFRELPSHFDDMQRAIHREADATLPQWDALTKEIGGALDKISPMLSLLADPVKLKETDVPPALVTYFTGANARYKSIADDVKAYQDKIAKLPTLKVQDVLAGMGRNSIVILGPDSAKVLAASDIYAPQSAQDNPDAPTQLVFKGEEAISSALLAMARPDKVKVVFVSSSPQHLLTGDLYSDMAEILRQSNFDVLEWSPPVPPSPGQPPPENQQDTPPGEGKGVVWVVFPGDANPQQMMMAMPNNEPLIAAIHHHMDAGGDVLFFAESSAASSGPMGDLSGGGYPFDSIVKAWGVNVLSKYTVVHQVEGEDRNTGARISQIAPYVDVDRYEDHEITRPIQSLPTAFFPANAVTAVDLIKPLPAGITAQILIKTPFSSDYWGEANFSRTATFDKGTDLVAPVPLAVVAVKNKGQKETEQRIMVVGTKYLGANPVLEAVGQPEIRGNTIVQPQIFPGNSEIMRNSILWLAGYENMIAVSAKANAGVRIGSVSSANLTLIRCLVLVGAPMLALLLGGSIWFVRRR